MGVTLYKAGDINTVRGVKCELCTFDENSFDQYLERGWFFTPEECYAEKETAEIPTEEETTEETETKAETDGILILDEMSDDEIRVLAKERDIKNWYNKKIDTLKSEIDAWQPEI